MKIIDSVPYEEVIKQLSGASVDSVASTEDEKKGRVQDRKKYNGLDKKEDKKKVSDQTAIFEANKHSGFIPEPLPEGKKRRRSELVNEGHEQSAQKLLETSLDPAKKEFNAVLAYGVRFLSIREHSVKEITTKLLNKTEDSDVVHAVVDELLERKYLCNERFTESFVRSKANRGVGPLKIRAELKNKGINSTMIQDHLDESSIIWFEHAKAQYTKKFGDSKVVDYTQWSKRARFLQSRGFSMEHIQVTVPNYN